MDKQSILDRLKTTWQGLDDETKKNILYAGGSGLAGTAISGATGALSAAPGYRWDAFRRDSLRGLLGGLAGYAALKGTQSIVTPTAGESPYRAAAKSVGGFALGKALMDMRDPVEMWALGRPSWEVRPDNIDELLAQHAKVDTHQAKMLRKKKLAHALQHGELEELRRAKSESDRGHYAGKHNILKRLIAKNRSAWEIGHHGGHYSAKHKSGYKFHIPMDKMGQLRKVARSVFAKAFANEPIRYDTRNGIVENVMDHLGKIQARGQRFIDNAAASNRFQNSMNPARGREQFLQALRGIKQPGTPSKVDQFLSGFPLQKLRETLFR